MKKSIIALVGGLLLSPVLALGQAFTSITATGITVDNGSGSPVNPPTGSNLCFLGVNSSGASITYTPLGGGPVTGPVCQTMNSSGNLTGSLQVANPATASPSGLLYTITVTNGSTTYLTLPQVQLSGALFNFPTYALPVNGHALGIGSPHLACNAGSTWTSTTYPTGLDSFTCTQVSGSGQWQQYPKGGNYCPAGMGYLAPQGNGQAFCLPPILAGIGAPTGSCVKNSTYYQQDSPGTAYACVADVWQPVAGGGIAGLTSFQGRSTAGATLQTTDVQGVMSNSPFSMGGTMGIGYDSAAGTVSPSSTWFIGTGGSAGSLIGLKSLQLRGALGGANVASISAADGSASLAMGAFTVSAAGVAAMAAGSTLSGSPICTAANAECPTSGAAFYQTAQNNTTSLTARNKLSFLTATGITGTDNAGNGSTDLSLSAIPNASLANSGITINVTGAATGGGTVALGGSTTINVTGGGGGGSVLTGTQKLLGTYQTTGAVIGPALSAQDSTAYQLLGIFNADLYQSGGGNNGVENVQTNCGTSTNCVAQTPPNSTSTDLSITLGVTSNNNSFEYFDYRYNSLGEYFTNPQVSSFSAFQFQAAYNRSVAFTVDNPGPAVQGGTQAMYDEFNFWLAPGFSNGQSGCPLFCPLAGYTNVSNWSAPTYRDTTNIYAGQGIRGSAENNFFNGRGDSYPIYWYTYYHGGCDSPSDECNYVEGASHGRTQNDWAGTVATITDAYHMTATTSSGNADQGAGLWVLDFTNVIENLQNVAIIHAPEDSSSSYPYGTVVFDAAAPNLPVSYAIGTVVTDCDVPVQQGTEASTSCKVHSTTAPFTVSGSGAPDGSGLFCAAANYGGNMIFGAQITAVTAPDGSGNQIVTFTTDRSVPAVGGSSVASVAAQGGACGTVVMFNADSTNISGGLILGSTFPVFVSPDNHTVGYASYFASGQWQGAPNNGTRMRTEASALGSGQGIWGGGIPINNVSRVGGVLTGVAFDQQIPPLSDTLVGEVNTTISGCSDSSVNGFQTGAGGWTRNAAGQLSIPQAGSNTTCSGGAYVTLGQVGTSLYWAAKALDVTNHTPGVIPIVNLNNPVFFHTYQPHFVVGHAIEQAAHYAAQSTGHNLSMEFVQPQASLSQGYVANMENYNAVSGAGYILHINPLFESLAGIGGVQTPISGLSIDRAPPANAVTSQYQPIHDGCGMCFGFTFYGASPGMQEFDFLGVNAQQQSLHYNNLTSAWSFSNQSNHYASFSPSGIFLGPNTFIGSLSYGAFTLYPLPHALIETTTIADCSTQQGSGTTCYDNASVGAPVTGQVGVPGVHLYNYVIGIIYPDGISLTPPGQVFTGNATLDTSNYNTISCSVLPTGAPASPLYEYDASTGGALNVIGTCTSSSTVINDQGTRGSLLGGEYVNMTSRLNAGGYTANGNGLGYCYSVQNLFLVFSSVGVPYSGCMSSPSAGLYSLDTTTPGNGLGNLNANSIALHGSLRTGKGAFSTAPACASGTEGTQYAVTDSTVSTWGTAVAGGGTDHVLAYCDGTSYTVMAN